MKKKYKNINKVEEINKRSDELIQILKNICKNNQMNIFTILYGLLKSPFIVDFIRLLKITNNKFKDLKCNDNDNSITFKKKLITYLSTDKNGNKRYCNIEKYVLSEEGPSEKLSEFFCNIMEEEREIIDVIYDSLPKEVTNEKVNRSMEKEKDEEFRKTRDKLTFGGAKNISNKNKSKSKTS